jgi:DNA-binding IscR family transcriptional regulator
MKISQKKREKISEQILAFLFSKSPRSFFTSQIAQELARDEEFIKKILLEIKEKGLVNEISKNPKGRKYKLRRRWSISDKAYEAYKQHQ